MRRGYGAAMAIAALLAAGTARAAGVTLGESFVLGEGGLVPPAPLLRGGTAEHPHVSRLKVDWEWLAPAAGVERFADLEAALALLDASGHRVVLSLVPGPEGTRRPAPDRPDDLRAWLLCVRRAAVVGGARLAALEVVRGGAGPADPVRDAFLLKQGAVAARSARPGFVVALGLDPAGDVPLETWLRSLYEEGSEPYVDAFVMHRDAAAEPPRDAEVAGVQRLRLALDPGAPLLAAGLTVEQSAAAATLFGRLSVLGVAGCQFEGLAPAAAGLLSGVHRRLGPHATPMAPGGVEFVGRGGEPTASYTGYRFFDQESAVVRLLIVPDGGSTDPFHVVLETFDVTEPGLYDPSTGVGPFQVGLAADRAANRATLSVPGIRAPVLLEYRRFATPGFAREDIDVATGRELPVEEILARHQEVRTAGEADLQSILADAVVDVHYTVAGGSATFDLTYRGAYFWTRESQGEYEYTETLVQGSRWKDDRFPQLPLIQPEKVVTVPLDIHLRREYGYVLRGTDVVDGQPAWRIDFLPLDETGARYSGTVWIDKGTFRRVRLSVVQTGLEPPVLSSEQIESYAGVPTPAGATLDFAREIRGEQLWNLAGVTFVVRREVRFENVRVNDPGFEARRAAAYASNHTMLRDTEEGLRYLVADESGTTRVVQPDRANVSRFALGGLYAAEDVDGIVPYAGLEYFHSDLRGSGQQLNLFLAGAVNFITWADPALGGSRVDAAANTGLFAISSTDRFHVDGVERESAEVATRQQWANGMLGVRLGDFVRLRGWLEARYENYHRGDDTAPDFIVPTDTWVTSIGSDIEFNRRGFTLGASSSLAQRADWQPWGDPDPASTLAGSRLADFDPEQEDFFKTSVWVRQEFYLPRFQKVRFGLGWLDGSDLDRFSQYQFSFFRDEVRVGGFSGSGVRFARGGLATARYTFNVASIFNVDLRLDHARVAGADDGTDAHTGVALAGKFVIPWGLIVQVDYGYALASDLAEVEGEQEFRLLLFKIF